MNTALLVILLSLASLVAAVIFGGAVGVAAVRFGDWLRGHRSARVFPPRERESMP